MLSSLLVVVPLCVGGDQRLLHAATADLYLEVADAQAVMRAYEAAPMMRLMMGEQMQRLDTFGKQLGWDLSGLVGGMLPVADTQRPDDRWWPWSKATRVSMSMTGLEPQTGNDMGGTLVVDFAAEEAAVQALQALGAMRRDSQATVKFSGQELAVTRYETSTGQQTMAGWAVRDGTRIIAGMGGMEPDDVAGLVSDASVAAHPERFTDDGLSPAKGTTVYRAWSDMESIGTEGTQGLGSTLSELQGWASGFVPFLGTRGKWRVELDATRFVTESLVERIGPARTMDAAMGVAPVPAVAHSWVPAEAAGAWTTTVAPAEFETLLDRWLELPASPTGAVGLSGLVDNACAVYLLPYPALMQAAQSPPRVVIAMRTTDKEAFAKAMDAKTAAALQANSKQRVDTKPYRRNPMWVFAAEEEAAPAQETAAPSASPFAALGGGGDMRMRPTVALVGDRVLMTLSPTIARSEVKRLLDEKEARPHALANLAANGVPADAFEASTMDWGGFIGGLWDQARGLIPMLAQGGAEPVDLTLLPTSADLFGGFQPTVSWSRRVPQEGRATLVHARNESSFGPETPLMMAGMMYLGVGAGASRAEKPPAVETLSTQPTTPVVPAEQAAAETLTRTNKALRAVKTALAVHKSQAGRFANTLDELLVGTEAFPEGFLSDKKLPLDGWNRALVYRVAEDGKSYELRSFGPDGIDQSGGGDDVKAP